MDFERVWEFIKKYNLTQRAMSSDPIPIHLDDGNIYFKSPILGYVFPVICVIAFLSNTLFLITFVVGKMNSPSHTLLKNIAVADTMTIVMPTCCYVYMYTLGNYKEYIPFEVCRAWYVLSLYVPTISHTASIWLTCTLAIQRYICVSYPLKVRIWCGAGRTYLILAIIYCLSIGCHITRFFEHDFVKVTVKSRTDPSKTMDGCLIPTNKYLATTTYVVAYHWMRSIFVHILPCIAMIVFSGRMLYIIRRADKSRETFQRRTKAPGQNETQENRLTTWLVIFVVCSVIAVEMPAAIYFLVYTADVTSQGDQIIPYYVTEPITVSLNLLLIISYPFLFIMYCCMSKTFRKSLKGVVCLLCRRSEQDESKFDGRDRTRRGGSSRITPISDGSSGKSAVKPTVIEGGCPSSDRDIFLINMNGMSKEGVQTFQNGGKRRSTKVSIISDDGSSDIAETKTLSRKRDMRSSNIVDESAKLQKNKTSNIHIPLQRVLQVNKWCNGSFRGRKPQPKRSLLIPYRVKSIEMKDDRCDH